MKINQKYLSTLMEPLKDNSILTLSVYLDEIAALGVDIESEEFNVHLRHLCSKKMISNLDGESTPKKLGFNFVANGKIGTIIGSIKITAAEKEETASNSNFIFNGPVTTQQAQFGNDNNQNVTINMQKLVEEVVASGDKEAKGMLMKLLENPTISGVIGAGVTGLIGLLGN